MPTPVDPGSIWDYISKIIQGTGFVPSDTSSVSSVSSFNPPPGVTVTPGSFGPGVTIPGSAGGSTGSGPDGGASYGPWKAAWDQWSTPAAKAAGFGPWGGPSADGPPSWLAKAALAAYQAGDQKEMKHILDSVTGPDGPGGSLAHHIINFLNGLFAGDPDRINEAKYYSLNPSTGGIPSGIGDGIPGDGK